MPQDICNDFFRTVVMIVVLLFSRPVVSLGYLDPRIVVAKPAFNLTSLTNAFSGKSDVQTSKTGLFKACLQTIDNR